MFLFISVNVNIFPPPSFELRPTATRYTLRRKRRLSAPSIKKKTPSIH